MSNRSLFAAPLLGLILALPGAARAADDKKPQSDKPAVVLRLASLDHLRGDFRYLADVVGQGEKAKQFDELIKSKLGDQGLQGIDTKKPIGAYGWIGEFGIDSKVVLMLPIADKKAFLGLVSDILDVKPEKGADDVYSMSVENVPGTVYFRFANDYVYATVRDKDVLDKNKLLAPSVVLPEGKVGTVSVAVNIDEISDDLKEKALAVVENHLAGLKDREMPGHTAAQKKLHDAGVDEASAQIKSLLNHGGETTLRLDLDRKAGELSLTASVAGKSGSALAESIHKLGQIRSMTASLLGGKAALKGELNISLPEKLRSLLDPALKDAQKQILAKTKDAYQRDVVNTLIKGVMPTLQAAELDGAINLQGPSDKGIYTILGGIKVKDAATLEKSLRQTASRLPKQVSMDAEKVNGVSIHRLNQEKEVKPSTRRTLGDNPIYFAIREDVLLIGAGDNGLGAVKDALSLTPATGKLMELQVALGRLVPLFDDTKQKEVAGKVFAENKDGGRIHVTVEGGKALTARLVLDVKVIDYVNQVEKAKKE